MGISAANVGDNNAEKEGTHLLCRQRETHHRPRTVRKHRREPRRHVERVAHSGSEVPRRAEELGQLRLIASLQSVLVPRGFIHSPPRKLWNLRGVLSLAQAELS